MATKSKTAKSRTKAAGSGQDTILKSSERIFRMKLGKNDILTMKLSLGSAPVGGKGPRPKKDDLLLLLIAALTGLLAGKTPKPVKKKFIAGALVGGKGRKPPGANP